MLILDGGIVGTHAGDMMGEITLASEMDEVDIDKTIHPRLDRCPLPRLRTRWFRRNRPLALIPPKLTAAI